MSVDAETLILAVKKHPCVWNIAHEDYHCHEEKKLAWENVCKEIFLDDWDQCSTAEKELRSTELKKKWTNIRDAYRKDLQKERNVSKKNKLKSRPYVYSGILAFLKPMFGRRNIEDISQNVDSENSMQESDTEETNIFEEVDVNTNMAELATLLTPVAHSSRNRKDTPSQTQSVRMIQPDYQKSIEEIEQEQDDDSKFLLSFRSYMKRMNVNQKIDFKVGMLQLVKNINAEHPLYNNISYTHNGDNVSENSSSHEYFAVPMKRSPL